MASMFRRFYRDKKEMKEFLAEELGVPQENLEKVLLSKEKLQKAFGGFFRSIGEGLSKEDQQEFFAMLPHNPTNESLMFDDFARLIYE